MVIARRWLQASLLLVLVSLVPARPRLLPQPSVLLRRPVRAATAAEQRAAHALSQAREAQAEDAKVEERLGDAGVPFLSNDDE